MQPAGRLALGVLALAAGSIAALAQSAVISARSGLLHYVEGQVYVGDQLVETKFGSFPEVKENQQLKTEEGRAEVLLTPGVFLRIGENSSFRMITNRLIDTRLEFLSGSAVVDAEGIGKDNSVTVVYRDATVHPTKKGIYRFDSESGELRVYDGEAEVTAGDRTVVVKEGHSIALDTLAMQKFDKTVNDALNRWSERRDGYVSMANVGAASSLRNSMFSDGYGFAGNGFPGYGYGGYGYGGMFGSGWFWNPFFGMYSFIPGFDGMFYSAYGNPYYNPFNVGMAPGYYSGYYPGSSGYSASYSPCAKHTLSCATKVYNSMNYKSVPVRSHPSQAGRIFGSGGSYASVHGGAPSSGSSRSVSTGSVSSGMSSGSASHGGGGGGAGGGGGGGHH